jgi:CheY-like chemotaxis protein/DNA-binding HxlR family transcriptional regulator
MRDILVLDDDSTLLQILSGVLATAGYACHESTSPSDALATLVGAPQISVVLCDYYMPGMNGLEFAARAASLDRPTPRVLLMTAQPSMQMAVDALRLGVCDFLVKPATPSQVVEAVQRAMHRSAVNVQASAGRAPSASEAPDLGELIRRAQDLAVHLEKLAASKKSRAWSASAPIEQAPLLQTMETFRRLRAQCITREKLDEAAWEMLLDMHSAERRGQRLSVSGLMVSSSHVSSTTLLRRVNDLVKRGFIKRIPDPRDARRHFVMLTAKANELVSTFLAQLGEQLYPAATPSRRQPSAPAKLPGRFAAGGGR